jgi:hypothetical protein
LTRACVWPGLAELAESCVAAGPSPVAVVVEWRTCACM